MAAAKRKKKTKRPVAGKRLRTAIVLSIVLAIALSLVVRWALDPPQRVRRVVRVEVLNGTERVGLAKRVRNRLIAGGVDVLRYDNAGRQDFEHTLILDRGGGPDATAELARITGCRRVLIQELEDAAFDATLIIGKDIDRLPIGRDER
ncbi:MAG: LytR C-terminal domain-containing protein [Candidatus Krumholzibacteriota bacterium]|nr:LytR C-terminal domain-containing protein [Candidatus Krumholzibacteriota bacterium]